MVDSDEAVIQRDEKPGPSTKSVCEVLQCTFDDDRCSMDISNSMWTIARGGTSNTGIQGDASSMPYNPGYFSEPQGYRNIMLHF